MLITIKMGSHREGAATIYEHKLSLTQKLQLCSTLKRGKLQDTDFLSIYNYSFFLRKLTTQTSSFSKRLYTATPSNEFRIKETQRETFLDNMKL